MHAVTRRFGQSLLHLTFDIVEIDTSLFISKTDSTKKEKENDDN